VSLVFEDEIVRYVVSRPAGVDPSSTIEQPGKITCQRGFRRLLLRQKCLLKDMLVIVQDDYVLGTQFQSNDRTVLICPFVESRAAKWSVMLVRACVSDLGGSLQETLGRRNLGEISKHRYGCRAWWKVLRASTGQNALYEVKARDADQEKHQEYDKGGRDDHGGGLRANGDPKR
jgi:hypothetical protein